MQEEKNVGKYPEDLETHTNVYNIKRKTKNYIKLSQISINNLFVIYKGHNLDT